MLNTQLLNVFLLNTHQSGRLTVVIRRFHFITGKYLSSIKIQSSRGQFLSHKTGLGLRVRIGVAKYNKQVDILYLAVKIDTCFIAEFDKRGRE
jgi:hypothetical protein